MTQNEHGFSTGYFLLSVVLHTLAVFSIFLAPRLELLDEGSGHAIEFVAMQEPKGEQLNTPIAAEKEVITEKPVKKTVKTPSPSLEDLKPKSDPSLPENLDSEVSEKEPETQKVATELPEKKEEAPLPEPTPVEETPEDTKYDDFLAEESDANIVAPEETSEAAKDSEPQAPVMAPVATDKELKALEEGQKAPAVAQNQSHQDYGKPSGKVRSYLDLSQVKGNKPPHYPTLARRMNQQGQVQLAYFVNSDGSIENIKLVKSSGYKLLDKEALRAVSQYKYKPGQAGWTLHPVNFQLQGPVKKMPSRLRTSGRSRGQ